MDWELEVSRCNLLHLVWIHNKILLYSTGKCIQSLGQAKIEKNILKKNVYVCMYVCVYMCVCVCMTESLCCIAEISTTL